MLKHRWISILASGVAAFVIVSVANAQAGIPPNPYTQNFDTLANTGTSSTVPTGWAFLENGTSANTTYTAGTGSSTTGDTYSFGATSASDRAFGALQSGSVSTTIGVDFQNNTGATAGRLAITYNCEQWRIGVTSRGAADRMDFQYSLDATSLSTGAWTDFDTLDCLSTVTSGTAGALDGNTNRTSVSATILGLSIPDGSHFWIRWTDFNIAPGADDGLAVDDFSMQLQSPTAITLNRFDANSGSGNLPIVMLLIALSAIMLSGALIVRRRRI